MKGSRWIAALALGAAGLTLAVCGEPRSPSLPEPQPAAAPRLMRGTGSGEPAWTGANVDLAKLRAAAAAHPRDARTWSDLAAAYLLRAERQDQPEDLLRALAAADRALEIEGALAEALFNRALSLEALALPGTARSAWARYLRHDAGSERAEKARTHLKGLERLPPGISWDLQRPRLERAALHGDSKTVREIVRRYARPAREHAEANLLGQWGDARGRSAAVAERSLTAARGIGEGLVRQGEHLVRDAVAEIVDAIRQEDGERLADLAAGHRAYRDGFDLMQQGRWTAAAERFVVADAALRRSRSPLAARAAFYAAYPDYFAGRYGTAAEVFRRLAEDLSDRPYWALRGHVAWMEGLIRSVRGNPMAAVVSYERSVGCFERIGETDNVGAVHGLLAEAIHRAGQRRVAWEYQLQALHEGLTGSDPRRLYLLYASAADGLAAEGRLGPALLFQGEAVRQAVRSGLPQALTDARVSRALLRARAGRHREALDELRQVWQQVGTWSPEEGRARAEADTARTEGEILVNEDPRRAAALFTSAIAYYEGVEHRFLGLKVHRLRARAYRRLGDLARSEEDLQAAVSAYEDLEKFEEELLREGRLPTSEETEAAYDEMISFQFVERRRPEAAFAYADRARTRVLLGRLSQSGLELGRRETVRLLAAEPRSSSLEEIRRALPPDTSLVQLVVLPDRLLIWHIRRDGLRWFEQPVSRGEIEARVARLRRFASGSTGRAGWTVASSGLFDLLVRPWIGETAPDETLVFVPDKALHGVPFACLLDAVTGRFLVEDHPIAYAPSATLYSGSSQRGGASSTDDALPALAVGNPAFDRTLWQSLEDLPGAAAEAAALRRLFPKTRLIEAAGADKRTFLELAPRAERIHVAAHALGNTRNPLLSMLLFAPSGKGEPGALYAWEIYGLNLRRTHLVVLSACSTAGAPGAGGETAASLARAFLAAGAHQVVASSWDIEDRSASQFFSIFYGSLLSESDPTRALRAAQLAFLADHEEEKRAPWAWGAFQIFAASAQASSN